MKVFIGAALPPYDEQNVRVYFTQPINWDGYEYQDEYILIPKKFFREVGYGALGLAPHQPGVQEVEINVKAIM